jgi:hypothetical protein
MDNAIRPEHASEPHHGRITQAHKQLVRSHPHRINKRLRGGLREIDPADPTMEERPAGSSLILLAARYRRRRQQSGDPRARAASPRHLARGRWPGNQTARSAAQAADGRAYADGGATVMVSWSTSAKMLSSG